MGDCLDLNGEERSHYSYEKVKIAGLTRYLVKDPQNPELRCSCITLHSKQEINPAKSNAYIKHYRTFELCVRHWEFIPYEKIRFHKKSYKN